MILWLADLLEQGVELSARDGRLLYRAPVGVVTEELRRQIAERKDTLVPLLQAGGRYAPTSLAQQRLWLVQQLDPQGNAYNIPVVRRLEGRLVVPALEAAYRRLVERHESLRTTFAPWMGRPFQLIHEFRSSRLPQVDLSRLPAAARDPAALDLLRREAYRPFDLREGPLLRSLLVRLAPREHLLCLTLHHLITDGWSNVVLVRELWHLYEAALTGRSDGLPDPPASYVDFARWQRRRVEEEETERSLKYWKRQLEDLPLLALPTDRPRPSRRRGRGGARHRLLSSSLVEGVREVARGAKASLFVTFLAVFFAQLYRFTGQRDIVLGTFSAGRHREEFESLIGFFIDTIVLRVAIHPEAGFADLLQHVREVVLTADEHQRLPFERIVQELQPDRDLSRNPLFQISFSQFESATDRPPPGLTVEAVEFEDLAVPFDLGVQLMQQGERLYLRVDFSRELFDVTTIQRLMRQYLRLVSQVTRAPANPLVHLSPHSAGEQHQILTEWNDSGRSYTTAPSVWGLFAERWKRFETRPALVFEDQELVYAVFCRRASQLGRDLRRRGVGPEARVGVLVERSLELPIVLFGILAAGGAFVPLDPEDPRDRLAFKIEDSGVSAVVAQRHLVDLLPTLTAPVLIVDDVVWDPSTPTPLPGAAGPDHPAYLIYTSGSTGRPKGVLVTHRAILNRLEWMQDAYPIGAEDSILQKTPTSFDVSVWELLWPLLQGTRLVLAASGGHRDSGYLAHLIVSRRITTIHFVPSMLRAFLEDERSQRCRSLRRVIASGEALSPELVRRFAQRLPGIALHNLYGPTEAAVDVTAHPCSAQDPGGSVSIGRPVANTKILVLDEHLSLAPTGVVGELYIGGIQLARGYASRPSLTAQSFLPDPLGGVAGERLYRSGDLARLLRDGRIELLGRVDHQVKLRGQRIELAEVEAALRLHPAVREAVVLLREIRPGDPGLVAYVVPREAGREQGWSGELRSFLETKLPEPMTPAVFVPLPELPLTPNGKLDRRALPSPSPGRDFRSGVLKPPRTPEEEILTEIWRQVLDLPEVGVDDHFFRIGGHSLLAMRVISRVEKVFRKKVPPRALFESPTIEGLALRLTAERRRADPPLVPQPLEADAIPLSFAQQRLWFLQQLSPESYAYNSAGAFRLEGPLSVAALEASLRSIVERHETLRTTFPSTGGEPRQAVSPPPREWSLPCVDLAGLPAPRRLAEARKRSEEESRRPFDLVRGPLWRTWLYRLDEPGYVLALLLHHIVTDGWSMEVFYRELGAFYNAYLRDETPQIAALPIRYADFAVWQRRCLEATGSYEQDLDDGRRRLAGLSPLVLPTDRPRSPNAGERGASVAVRTEKSLAEGLHRLAAATETSLFMVLLSTLSALLYRVTGQNDFAVGSPIAGRNHYEIEGLIGFFVNTLVVRIDASGPPSFLELLERVREETLAAYDGQDLPFEKWIEGLGVERDLNVTPLFQVLFVVNNTAVRSPELSGIAAEPLALELRGTKYDLTVTLDAQRLEGDLRYRADLFDATTARRLSGHLQVLLAGVAADPSRRLGELPLLRRGERHQLLVEGAGAASEPAVAIHQLFEAQAAEIPERVALTFEDTEVTYGDLDRRADALADELRRRGVAREARVAICLERSPTLVATILAVLKAQGAYMLLDPRAPRARLRSQLREIGACLLLAENGWLELASRETPALEPSAVAGNRTACTGEGLRSAETLPLQAAYVTLTSGSTGRPRAVVMSHREAAVYLAFLFRRLGLGRRDVVLQVSPPSFDMVVRDLLGPLAAGARVVLLREDQARDGAVQLERIATEGVTCVLGAVPALLRGWLATGVDASAALVSLRWLVVGGEALPGDLVRWSQKVSAPATRWLNQYGTCESYGAIAGTVTGAGHRIPVGFPRPGTVARILDRSLALVGLGVPGDLYVGGAGLARGYLGQPRRTAEKYLPDPWSFRGGQRLYRTGDLARRRGDGRIEILGRTDDQIKLRGFRLEPEEIEAALAAHPGLGEAAVALRELGSGSSDRRLVAWTTPSGDAPPPSPRELHRFLARSLPEHMIPGRFLRLAKLPRNPRGKIDRAALGQLPVDAGTGGAALHEAVVAPRGPWEDIVVETWAEVLGTARSEIGVHHNFFEIGGHSLLAAQVVARLRGFAPTLTLRDLFERPTPASLAERLAADRRGGATPGIVAVGRDRDLVLSFAQQRLWFLQKLEPERSVYVVNNAWVLEGPLDPGALESALRELVRRHEVLRTTFPEREGVPRQRIQPAEPSGYLVTVGLDGLPEHLRRAETERRLRTLTGLPFDLREGPLLRAFLLRLGAPRWLLVLSLHHIVTDGWSQGILCRELGALYSAFSQGRPFPLPRLPIQYADYAVWQRERQDDEVLEPLLAYWRGQLAGMSALQWPEDRPRSAATTYRAGVCGLRLESEATRALHAMSLRRGTTLFMTLVAAFLTLLHRVTGQEDLAVGSPVAHRGHPELEGLIGFFVNTLVLRGDLAGDPTFRDLLARVRDVVLGAFVHQDLPFERLVDELQPGRDLSRHPLFQVFLVLQNVPRPPFHLRGLEAEPLELGVHRTHFDIEVYFWESERLEGRLLYNSDLFDATTIRRFCGHLERLLAAVVAREKDRLGELPLWTAAQEHQAVVEWNEPTWPAAVADDVPVTRLFEARCLEAPERLAVVAPGGSLTYRELHLRSDHLARRLAERGVAPEMRIGLLHERSPAFLVALLAILKAGGAYVALDPSYPRERLELMIDDAGIRILVASEASLRLAPFLDRPDLLTVLSDDGADTAFDRSIHPESAAYVIYTSGSTGRPKGVVIEHRSLSWYVRACAGHYALVPGDRVLQTASISFDISVGEIFPALAFGATVVLAPLDSLAIPDLLRFCREHGVTVLFPATALWHELAAAAATGAEMPPALRLVSFGGERVSRERIADWSRAVSRKVRLTNGYGPTEGTVEATLFELIPGRDGRRTPGPESLRAIPVGRPVAETRLYILDRRLRALPVGIPGELAIAGPGVARGYIDRPAATAESFVPHPQASTPGERLYRTGDLARLRGDGHLDLVGRLDRQLKIRGFRVEPGEVEAALTAHPEIEDAAVVAHEGPGGNGYLRLTAFAVACPAGRPEVEQLRAFLRRNLPEYLIPTGFSYLESLPLGPNGKLDRAALERLAATVPGAVPETRSAPRTPAERKIAAIWSQVLGLKRLGVHQGFFELGGDSILTIRVVALARREGLHIRPKDLFEHQTIAELAAAVKATKATPDDQDLVTGAVPLTPIQVRFFEHRHPEPAHFNTAAFLKSSDALVPVLLERAVAHLIRHHDALRLRFVRQEGTVRQENAGLPRRVPFSQADLSGIPASARPAAVQVLSAGVQKCFDLETGPLLRATLFTTGSPEEDRMLLLVHHLVADEVSWSILLEDLGTLYRALRAGEPVVLPAKTTSYKEWAGRLAEHARGEEVAEELDLWRRQLRGAAPLPVDFERRPMTTATRSWFRVSLDEEPTRKLLRQVPAVHGTTVEEVLLTALARTLERWTGSSSLLVDREHHGRESIFPDVDLSRTVGWFLTLSPVRLDLQGAAGRDAALRAVRRQWRAIPRHGVGFGLLRYLGRPETVTELRRLPSPEVIFNYLGQRDALTAGSPGAAPLFESVGLTGAPLRSGRSRQPHLLEVHTVVERDRMSAVWLFDRGVHRGATIESLARDYLDELTAIIDRCLSPPTAGRPELDNVLASSKPDAVPSL